MLKGLDAAPQEYSSEVNQIRALRQELEGNAYFVTPVIKTLASERARMAICSLSDGVLSISNRPWQAFHVYRHQAAQ